MLGQHELARPICGNLSGSIAARSQPLRAVRLSPVGREDKSCQQHCQHSYTKSYKHGGHSHSSKANRGHANAVIDTKAKCNAVNNYIHSTKGIMAVVNILGVFCFRSTEGTLYILSFFYFKTTKGTNQPPRIRTLTPLSPALLVDAFVAMVGKDHGKSINALV